MKLHTFEIKFIEFELHDGKNWDLQGKLHGFEIGKNVFCVNPIYWKWETNQLLYDIAKSLTQRYFSVITFLQKTSISNNFSFDFGKFFFVL